ncbi:unnamed protein product [Dibothriocephalus latus]|uniref:Uncharacterized protein n=1 Tax=Dibothriocephalus latus TaxID=60516 RepID=A0A3P6TU02_DIBLA|nr:unnamed protein product [Dibothriocephalus latus]
MRLDYHGLVLFFILHNFQNVVGRLVGLRTENLPSPNHDIIQRLEKVLRFVSFDEKGRRRPSPPSVRSVRYVSPKGFESARKSRLNYAIRHLILIDILPSAIQSVYVL